MVQADKCTGCGACVEVCPKKCLSMKKNAEGFFYPQITGKCIKCGKCNRVCPVDKPLAKISCSQKAYAGSYKDDSIIRNSASGGIFAAVANYVWEKGGYVFGCVLEPDMTVHHIGTNDPRYLYAMQGSKYVQSSTCGSFSEAEKYLKEGYLVCYSGTPCQIDALLHYLGKPYENLITLDLVCHGVPSPDLFQKYIQWLEKRLVTIIVDYRFRSKDYTGWGEQISPSVKCVQNKSIMLKADIDPYCHSFEMGENCRESCYSCKYANLNRISDITMGDFWGYDTQLPKLEKDSRKGISLVICNSEKGAELVSELSDKLALTECDLLTATQENHNLLAPTVRPSCRDGFYERIEKNGFDSFAAAFYRTKTYKKNYFKLLIPQSIKRSIPKPIKRKIKN